VPVRSCNGCFVCLQVVLKQAPTLVDADTYITPSSFNDAIKARRWPSSMDSMVFLRHSSVFEYVHVLISDFAAVCRHQAQPYPWWMLSLTPQPQRCLAAAARQVLAFAGPLDIMQ
jgi:hypothetical protein